MSESGRAGLALSRIALTFLTAWSMPGSFAVHAKPRAGAEQRGKKPNHARTSHRVFSDPCQSSRARWLRRFNQRASLSGIALVDQGLGLAAFDAFFEKSLTQSLCLCLRAQRCASSAVLHLCRAADACTRPPCRSAQGMPVCTLCPDQSAAVALRRLRRNPWPPPVRAIVLPRTRAPAAAALPRDHECAAGARAPW